MTTPSAAFPWRTALPCILIAGVVTLLLGWVGLHRLGDLAGSVMVVSFHTLVAWSPQLLEVGFWTLFGLTLTTVCLHAKDMFGNVPFRPFIPVRGANEIEKDFLARQNKFQEERKVYEEALNQVEPWQKSYHKKRIPFRLFQGWLLLGALAGLSVIARDILL